MWHRIWLLGAAAVVVGLVLAIVVASLVVSGWAVPRTPD